MTLELGLLDCEGKKKKGLEHSRPAEMTRGTDWILTL